MTKVFMSHLQTDPVLSLQITTHGSCAYPWNCNWNCTKASDVSLSKISEVTQFFEDLPNVVDEQFKNRIKVHSLCDNLLAKIRTEKPDILFRDFFSLTQVAHVNLSEHVFFQDFVSYLQIRSMLLNLKLLSRVVKTQDVTTDQAPVTVSSPLPVAPAPVAFGMAAG